MSSEAVSVVVNLTIGGKRIGTAVSVPAGRTVPADLLPACRALSGVLVGAAAERSIGEGKTISCRAGCGACCRQIVPITRTEAHSLAKLVAGMPETRRQTIMARFDNAIAALRRSGMLEKLQDPRRIEPGKSTALGLEYFALGIACPFLENESCSIYEDRPLICREYLVTSDPEHCSRPTAQTVKCVKTPRKASAALAGVEETVDPPGPPWVPLVLAIEWAKSNPPASRPQPGPALLRILLEKLTGKHVPVKVAQPPLPRAAGDTRTHPPAPASLRR